MSDQGSTSEAQQPSSPDDNKDKAPTRIILTDSESGGFNTAEWNARWRLQDSYITSLEQRLTQQEGELNELRQSNERTHMQLIELQQREKTLVRRVTAKEQETQDYVCQLTELKNGQVPAAANLRTALLDPAVNALIQQLRAELQATKSKLEETQNDLAAWKFTPDSNTGKRLMAKCRLLHQENEELGKITSSGRVALLEGDLELQRKFTEEVRQSQLELDSFLADLDEDVEGMQSTILFLQQGLCRTKEAECAKNITATVTEQPVCNGPCTNRTNGDSDNISRTKDEPNSVTEPNEVTAPAAKRARRSSVLSLDYNEEDTLVINANGSDNVMSDNDFT